MSAAHKATSKPLKENDKAFAKRQEKEETHASRGRRGPYASRSSTRESIVATAIDLFREKGYANASLSELARRMGMDPSSLYYSFPRKLNYWLRCSSPICHKHQWKDSPHRLAALHSSMR